MSLKRALEDFTNAKILKDEPMKKHTGYGVGGCARFYAQVDSLYGLNRLISLLKAHRAKYKIIGNGTNILVSDLGYDGVIIDLKKLSDIFLKRNEVRAMAGAKLSDLLRFSLEHKYTGLEALSGIPATVGGAIVMNAGAFGHNISDNITTVETLVDGKIKIYDKNDCRFGYRRSRFLGKKEVVISATFHLNDGDSSIIKASLQSYLDLRKSMHPTGRSCGSVFVNPKPMSAGALIDSLGLKGYKIGGASVSEKHGNFIVTQANAKAKDVYLLIEYLKRKVEESYGISLVKEIECVGEF